MSNMGSGSEDSYHEATGHVEEAIRKQLAETEGHQRQSSPDRGRLGEDQAAVRVNVRGRGIYIAGDAIGSALGDYSQVHNEFVIQSPPEVRWPMQIGAVPPLASAFQERPALRKQIDAAPSEGTFRTLVLVGEGGVGKTQLAASYARRAETELVLWVIASDVSQVVTDYARAAQLVDAPGVRYQDVEDDARAFLEWLAATDRTWLIVLDNVDDPAALTSWWPVGRSDRGWVLATTRRRDAQGAGRRRIKIDLYTTDEARTYLTQRLKAEKAQHLADNQCDAMAEALGYLPLALGHAAAYLVNEGVTASRYLRLLLSSERRLDELLPADADVDGYGRTVTTALLLNLHAADQRCPHSGLARYMLQICALLDPAGHPEVLWTTKALHQYLGNQLRKDTSNRLDTLLPSALRPQGAKKKKPQRPRRQHPRQIEAQFVWNDRLSPDEQKELEKKIRTHFTQSGLPQTNPFRDAVARAMQAAPVKVEQQEVRDTLRILHRFSLLTHVESDSYRSVYIHTLTARTIRETFPAEYNEAYAVADAVQQAWAGDTNDSQFARAMEDSTVILMRHCGPMLCRPDVHPLLWRAGNSIGGSGKIRATWEFFARLLPIVTASLGPDHGDTLTTRNHMASWQGRSGDAAGAAQAFADLLSDQQRIGIGHRDTLITRSNIAQWRGRAGDLLGATESCGETLVDAEQILGHDDQTTVLIRQNLTTLRMLAGLTDSSAQTFADILSSQQRRLPPNHPETLIVRLNLASARAQEGDHAGAAEALAKLLPLFEHARGPHHPETFVVRVNLAEARGKLQGAASAVEAFTEILIDVERVLGPDHPETLVLRSKLADARGEAGDHAGAAQAYAKLLTHKEQVLGHDHSSTLITHNNLADWLGQSGDAAGAAEALTKLCPRLEQAFGINHHFTLSSLDSLAHWRREAGDASGAAEALTELFRRMGASRGLQELQELLVPWVERKGPESELQELLYRWLEQQGEDGPEA
ncbi:tetratricopeptide repeat protein [Streptomyces sp. NPDC088732]|uniref:tetratricopeptide repeat protein n=1 Tax=Streptomyces sp. NPDC088732 TaxID=3365879 RepID=UPI0038173B7C